AFFDEQRDRLLAAEMDRIVRSLRLLHGVAKEARTLALHRRQDAPASNGEDIPVWIRDGFSAAEKDTVDAAKKAGVTGAVIYVFIPRKSRDELLSAVAAEQAAEQPLATKGVPSTPEAQAARQSMESRLGL